MSVQSKSVDKCQMTNVEKHSGSCFDIFDLGEPSKLKSTETWEKFPTGGRGGSSIIQKSPKFPKVPKFEK